MHNTNAYTVCLSETGSAPGKDISSKDVFPFSCRDSRSLSALSTPCKLKPIDVMKVSQTVDMRSFVENLNENDVAYED